MATKKNYKIYCTKTFQGIVYGDAKFYNKLAFAVGKAKKIFKNKSEALSYQQNNIAELKEKYPKFLTISQFSDFRSEFNSTLELVNKAKRMKCSISQNINWIAKNTLSSVITNKKVNTNRNSLDKKMKKALSGDNRQLRIGEDKISQEIEKPEEQKNKEEIIDELIDNNEFEEDNYFNEEKISTTNEEQQLIYWDKTDKKKTNKLINDSIDKANIVVYTDASLSFSNEICLAMFLINDLSENKKTARAIKIDTSQFQDIHDISIDYIELVAIHSALEFLQNHNKLNEEILIVTDSNGAIRILNDNENNFGTGKYRDVAKSTYKLLDKFSNINLKLIKSHNKNYGNFLCDGIKYIASNKILNNK